MSICSSTTRAVWRSRIPSRTLLLVLRQTATNQPWATVTRSVVCRHWTSPAKDSDHIPFEDEVLPPSIDQEAARKTTITGSERAAFEKLYKKFNVRQHANKEMAHVVELDRTAAEDYEHDEKRSSQSLDGFFNEALKGHTRARGSRSIRPLSHAVPNNDKLDAATDTLQKPGNDKVQRRRKEAKAAAVNLKQLKMAERERVDLLLQHAKTDHELWQILVRQVFERVRKLNLDGTTMQQPAVKAKHRSELTASDPRIVFQNYPHHLITALLTLRTVFPSSQIPLQILPAIKTLGRSSYALGATTLLYKHLIRTAWVQQSSYSSIDTLLADMNNGAIEFDADILALLDSVIKEHDTARSGRLGQEIQMIYGMGQSLEGIGKLRQWRKLVAVRLGVIPQDKSTARRIVKSMDHVHKITSMESWHGQTNIDGSLKDTRVAMSWNDAQNSDLEQSVIEDLAAAERSDGKAIPQLRSRASHAKPQ